MQHCYQQHNDNHHSGNDNHHHSGNDNDNRFDNDNHKRHANDKQHPDDKQHWRNNLLRFDQRQRCQRWTFNQHAVGYARKSRVNRNEPGSHYCAQEGGYVVFRDCAKNISWWKCGQSDGVGRRVVGIGCECRYPIERKSHRK